MGSGVCFCRCMISKDFESRKKSSSLIQKQGFGNWKALKLHFLSTWAKEQEHYKNIWADPGIKCSPVFQFSHCAEKTHIICPYCSGFILCVDWGGAELACCFDQRDVIGACLPAPPCIANSKSHRTPNKALPSPTMNTWATAIIHMAQTFVHTQRPADK